MNLCVRIAFISLWLFPTSALSAQIGLLLPVINNIEPNEVAIFNVRVTGFDSIVGMQFKLRWDPEVFEFVSTSGYNLPELGGEDFGTSEAQDSGWIRLLWDNSNLLGGVTVADSTVIFRLRLRAIGQVNDGSQVYFSQDFLTPFDIVKANSDSSLTSYNIHQVALAQGFGAIGYTVAADEPSALDDDSLKIFPNPFSEKTTVSFDLKISSDVTLLVTDATGRILLENKMPQLPPGHYGTEIASPQVRQKGTYFFTIRAGMHTYTRLLSVF
ncbi:MAG: T9SS type A sorting domain-containing protein [Saprospiraceae bacterium]|nr:T9SS type A sorting domain-containing protein [Saprospiraceae bacterium]